MTNPDNVAHDAAGTVAPPIDAVAGELRVRAPRADDATAIQQLIAECPPLDRNSQYATLLQCTHFAGTCIVAERNGVPLAWVSGYRLPRDPSVLFVWQVAVRRAGRGRGLGKQLILALLARAACKGVYSIHTTITPDNAASFALFESVARALAAPLERRDGFDADRHFGGRHASERLVVIGPFSKSGRSGDNASPTQGRGAIPNQPCTEEHE